MGIGENHIIENSFSHVRKKCFYYKGMDEEEEEDTFFSTRRSPAATKAAGKA
jgi:hypothetical protein